MKRFIQIAASLILAIVMSTASFLSTTAEAKALDSQKPPSNPPGPGRQLLNTISSSMMGSGIKGLFTPADNVTTAGYTQLNLNQLMDACANRADSDGDGLPDEVEKILGTDPQQKDTDEDKLDDRYELVNGLDPLKSDSNNDGLGDYGEIAIYDNDTSDCDPTLDTDNDGIPNYLDPDNDNDNITDGQDLSPFSVGEPQDNYTITIKTSGRATYADFQIQPKNLENLYKNMQSYDWPYDAEGNIQDTDYSPKDMTIKPVLEIETNNPPSDEDCIKYGILKEKGAAADSNDKLYITLAPVEDNGKKVALEGRVFIPAGEVTETTLTGRLLWSMEYTNDRGSLEFHKQNNPPFPGKKEWIGAGADSWDLDRNGQTDVVVAGIVNNGSGHSFYYTVGYDLDIAGHPRGWSSLKKCAVDFPESSSGGGVALNDLDGDGKPEIILESVENREGADRFVYVIGWGLDEFGNVSQDANGNPHWSQICQGPEVGWNNAGAGVTLVDLNGNSLPEMIFMTIDDPEGANLFRYYIGWDVTADKINHGTVNWTAAGASNPLGWTSAGGDIEVAQLDNDSRPELILMSIDDAAGTNSFNYYVAWNVNTSGQPASWSNLKTPPWSLGVYSSGCALTVADFDGDGQTDDLFLLDVDNPEGGNEFWFRVGQDFNGNQAAGGWSETRTIISAADLPPHNIQSLDSRICDIDNNGLGDLVILWASWENSIEEFRYIIGWDLNTDGQPQCWSAVKTFQDLSFRQIKGSLKGLGFDLYDINHNGRPDLFVAWVGSKSEGLSYVIHFDLNSSGDLTGRTANDTIMTGYRDDKWGFTGTGGYGAETTMDLSVRLAKIRNSEDKVDVIVAAKALTWDGYAGTQAVRTVITVMPDLPVSGVFPRLSDGTLMSANQDLYSVNEVQGITYPQYKTEYEDWNAQDKFYNVIRNQPGVGLELCDLNDDGNLDALMTETSGVQSNSFRTIVIYNINSPSNVVIKSLDFDSINNLSDDEIKAGGTPRMGLGTAVWDYTHDNNLDAISVAAEKEGDDIVLSLYTAPNIQTGTTNILQEPEPFRLTGFSVEENNGGQAGVIYVHPCDILRGEYEDAMLNYEAIKQKYLDEWTHEGTQNEISIPEAVAYIFEGNYRPSTFALRTEYLSFDHGDEVTPWVNGVLSKLDQNDYFRDRAHWPFIMAVTNNSRQLNMDVMGTWEITSNHLSFDLTGNDFAQTRLLQMKSYDFKNNQAMEPWQIMGLCSTDLGAGLDDQQKVQLSTLLMQWNTGEYELTRVGDHVVFPQHYSKSKILTTIGVGLAATIPVFINNCRIVSLDAKVTSAIFDWVSEAGTSYKVFNEGVMSEESLGRLIESYRGTCNEFLRRVPRTSSYSPSQVKAILGSGHWKGMSSGRFKTAGSFSKGSLLERGNTLNKMMKWAGRAAFAVQVGFAIYAGVQVGLQFDEPAYGAYAGSVFAVLQIAWAAFMLAIPYAINMIKLGFSTTGIGIAVTLLLEVSDLISFLVCGKSWSQMVLEQIFKALVDQGVDVDVNIKNLSEDVSYDKMQKGLFVVGSTVRNISVWQGIVQDIKEHHKDVKSEVGQSYIVPYIFYPDSPYYTAANTALDHTNWLSFSSVDNLKNQIDEASYGFNEQWTTVDGMLRETTDYKYDNSLRFNTIKANLPVKIVREFEINITKWKKYGAFFYDDGALNQVQANTSTLYFDVMPQGLTQFRSDFEILPAYAGNARTETHQQSQDRMAARRTQIVALDADGDGLTTWGAQEKTADGRVVNTDPQKWDTDGDGVGDDMELAMGLDPLKADTDGDGLNDREELIYGTQSRLVDKNNDGDYLDIDEGDINGTDTDNDGLTDKQEINGWDMTFTYNGHIIPAHVCSDPLSSDTDADGLSDKDEYTNGTNPSARFTPRAMLSGENWYTLWDGNLHSPSVKAEILGEANAQDKTQYTRNLNDYFTDLDNDTLTFSTDVGSITAGGVWKYTFNQSEQNPKPVTIVNITAFDNRGSGQIEQRFILDDTSAPILTRATVVIRDGSHYYPFDRLEKAQNVYGVTPEITVYFNEPIEKGDNFTGITLKDAAGNLVACTNTVSGKKILITPDLPLSENRDRYTLDVPAGAAQDTHPNPSANSYQGTFITQDVTPPQVVDAPDNSTAFGPADPLVFTFSDDFVRLWPYADAYIAQTLYYPTFPPTPYDVRVSAVNFVVDNDNHTIAFTLGQDRGLRDYSPYKLILDPGFIQDLDGNRTNAITFLFTTGDVNSPLLVVDAGWGSQSGNPLILVDNSTPVIVFTYSENLVAGLNFSQIKVEHESQQNLSNTLRQLFGQFNGQYTPQVAGVAAMAMQELAVDLNLPATVSIQDNSLIIALSAQPLIPNYLYHITIPSGALQDFQGVRTSITNQMELSNTDSGVAPKIIWSGSLVNGELRPGANPALPSLNPGAHLGLAFNQPVTQGWPYNTPCPITVNELDADNHTLGSVNYDLHFESMRLDQACYAVRLELDHPLAENTTYRLTVPAGAIAGSLTHLTNSEYTKDFVTGRLELPGIDSLETFGLLRVGEIAYASFDFKKYNNMFEGLSRFQWYVSDDAQGTNLQAIPDAAGLSFAIPAEYLGKYLWFEVTPQVENGENLFPSKIGPFGPILDAFGVGVSLSRLQVTGEPPAGLPAPVLLAADNLSQPLQSSYNLGVDTETRAVTITAQAADNNSTIWINDLPGPLRTLPLKLGVNPIVVSVTAENGLLQRVYTVTVNRSESAEVAVLPDCFVQINFEGFLYPGMLLEQSSHYYDEELRHQGDSSFKWYRGDRNGANLIQVGEGPVYRVTAADIGFYLYVEMTPLTANGIAGRPVLSPGAGPVIDRQLWLTGVYDLDSLSLTAEGTELLNNFSPAVTVYTRSLGLSASQVIVSAAASPSDAVIRVNDLVLSGTQSVDLKGTQNLITVSVERPTAGGPEIVKTYTINILRTTLADIPQVSNVHIDGSPAAGENVTADYQYSCTLPEGESLYVWSTAADSSGAGRTIVGTSTNSYLIRSDDAGRYLFFEVQPVNNAGTFGNPLASSALGPLSLSPQITSTAPLTLEESAANDGSLQSGAVQITIRGGELADPLEPAAVTPAHLPEGLDYSVARVSATRLTVFIEGQSANHAYADSINNLTFTISRSQVSGASADLTTAAIALTFSDPAPAAPADGLVDDRRDTFGWTNTPGYDSLADYQYSLDGGANWSLCYANPQAVGNQAYAAGDVRVRVRPAVTAGVPAGAELVSLQAFSQTEIKAGAGLTVIIHGFQPVASEPSWTSALQQAIVDNYTDSAGQSVKFTVTGSQGDLQVSTTPWDVHQAAASGTQIVVRVDWSAVANHLTSYITVQEVAAAIAPYLYRSQNGQPPLSELPIHLIGHSRGAALVYALAELLGQQGLVVDQLTSLDPHPLTADDPQGNPQTLDAAISGVPDNVLFADNYYQTLQAPVGQSIAGAYNRQLTALNGGYHNHPNSLYRGFADHLNVVLWYLGTIIPSGSVFDGQATLDSADRGNWYNTYESQGQRAGFYYSLIKQTSGTGGGNRFSADRPVAFGDRIIDGVDNDTALGGQGGRLDLTWSAAVWPNLVTLDILRSGEPLAAGVQNLLPGENLALRCAYRDYAGRDNLTWYADRDTDPYNDNNLAVLAVAGPLDATGSTITRSTTPWTVASLLPGQGYYLYAEIQNDNQTRYLYASQVIQEVVAEIYSTSPLTLPESAANDGSLDPARIVITIINGTLAGGLDSSGVRAANLPPGLGFSVQRDSATQCTLTLTGAAANHAHAADIDNLTFTLDKSQVNGAADNLTTAPITLDFNDPAPAAPTAPQVNDDFDTFGWTEVSGYSGFSNYEFSLDSGSKWSGCSANPQSVGDRALAIGVVQVRVKADSLAGRPAGAVLSSDQAFSVADETPAAPTDGLVDDDNDTFQWTTVSGYSSFSYYQFSVDSGAEWADCAANPQYIGNHNIAAGAVRVRVKAHLSTGAADTQKTHPAGQELASAAPFNRTAAILSISPNFLTEAAANDGSLASPQIVITIADGQLAGDIADSGVSAANLPANLGFSVQRDNATQCTITLTGRALRHADADDVDNLTFTLDRSKVENATHDLTTDRLYLDFGDFALTTAISGQGSVVKYPDRPLYPSGVEVKLKAVASSGWKFSSWSGPDNHSGTNADIIMDDNSTVRAVFTAGACEVGFNSQGGSAVENQTLSYGDKVVEPSAPTRTGYTFGRWYQEPACTHLWRFDNDTLKDNITLFADWTLNSYDLTVDLSPLAAAVAGDNVTGNTLHYDYDTPVNLTAHSVAGWQFSAWSSADISLLDATANPLTFNMPAKAVTLTAIFIQTQPLTRPDQPVLKNTTAAWSAVPAENNGYAIQLYHDNVTSGTPVLTAHGSALSHSFAAEMVAVGSYSVTVVARGSGSYTDSAASEPSDLEIVVGNGGLDGQAQLPAADIQLGDNGTLDLQAGLQTVDQGRLILENQTYAMDNYSGGALTEVDLTQSLDIGGQSLVVQQGVRIESGENGQPVTLTNSDNPNLSITIPDGTAVMAAEGWDGTLIPPQNVPPAGLAPSGFSIGATVIEVGSPAGILVFDQAVVLELKGVTGPVGYKAAGSDAWVTITTLAGGVYAAPLAPPFPGEAYITNGTDTKIITWHFSGFAGLNDLGADNYTIRASSGPHGTITPAGAVVVNAGTDRTFNITPDPGYHISTLLVDGSPVTRLSSYTFQNVSADHTLRVTFARNTAVGGEVAPARPHTLFALWAAASFSLILGLSLWWIKRRPTRAR
jgi:uncharacterized repeat protein (TIGR02543 family)